MVQVDAKSFCEQHRRQLRKHWRLIDIVESSVEDRIESLRGSFGLDPARHTLPLKLHRDVIRILQEAFSSFVGSVYFSKNQAPRINANLKAALRHIEALRKMNKPFTVSGMGGGSLKYLRDFLTPHGEAALRGIESRINNHLAQNIAIEIRRPTGKEGKPGRRYARRKFALPYEWKVGELLKAERYRAEHRCEIIANLFYGIGVELSQPSSCAKEIGRALTKEGKTLRILTHKKIA